MNWKPPPFALEAVEKVMQDVPAQHYSLPKGRVALRQEISKEYSDSFNLGRPLDINTEIVVTAGANEGILAVFTAFINPGDEVIVFEPFFDQYSSNISFQGGKPAYVPIR